MATTYPLLLLATTLFLAADGSQLPSYIKTCKKSDPKLNECFVTNANLAIPDLMLGDAKYNLSQYKPYVISPMDLKVGANLNYHLSHGIIVLSFDVEMHRVKMEFKEKSLEMDLGMRLLTWLVDYEATGTVSGKAVHEKGQAYIVLYDVEVFYTCNFDSKSTDGKSYLEVQKCNMKSSSKAFEFLRYNQENLGDELNDADRKIFNEESRKLLSELKKKVLEIGSSESRNALNNVFKLVPENEIFP